MRDPSVAPVRVGGDVGDVRCHTIGLQSIEQHYLCLGFRYHCRYEPYVTMAYSTLAQIVDTVAGMFLKHFWFHPSDRAADRIPIIV